MEIVVKNFNFEFIEILKVLFFNLFNWCVLSKSVLFYFDVK